MLFTVLAPDMGDRDAVRTPFAFRQDNWTDNDLATRYQLYEVCGTLAWPCIGDVLIYRLGQRPGERHQLSSGLEIYDLSEEHFSMGATLEYYTRLIALPGSKSVALLTAIRDIAFDGLARKQFLREAGLCAAFGPNGNEEFLENASSVCRHALTRKGLRVPSYAAA